MHKFRSQISQPPRARFPGQSPQVGFCTGDGPGSQTTSDRTATIPLEQFADQETAVAGGQFGCAAPAVLSDSGDQLLGPLQCEPIISGAETAASAFTFVLESDAPIGALDAAAIGLYADRAEEVELSLVELRLGDVYATLCFHAVPRYVRI